MLEDTALVQSCLLKIEAGDWKELQQEHLEVLLNAELIQPFAIRPHGPLDNPANAPEYQLTQAGRDKLWPPKK